MKHDAQTWVNYAEAFAFLGNSLLAPMNQTGTVGLVPEFWQQFPTFDDEEVARALKALEAYAEEAQAQAQGRSRPQAPRRSEHHSMIKT